MGAFKDSTISDEADKPLDYCDDCGNGIYVGQAIWKIGGEIYCCSACFKNAIGAVEPMLIT